VQLEHLGDKLKGQRVVIRANLTVPFTMEDTPKLNSKKVRLPPPPFPHRRALAEWSPHVDVLDSWDNFGNFKDNTLGFL
jgi:hypothetical protein